MKLRKCLSWATNIQRGFKKFDFMGAGESNEDYGSEGILKKWLGEGWDESGSFFVFLLQFYIK